MRRTFPRVCGGDPRRDTVRMDSAGLFPACAGVIPRQLRIIMQDNAFPRVCGGDPTFAHGNTLKEAFSPRVRG